MTEYEYLTLVNELRPQFDVLKDEYEIIGKELGSDGKLERQAAMHEFKRFAINQKKFADEMTKRRNEHE